MSVITVELGRVTEPMKGSMHVTVEDDGSVVVHMTARDAACLAGRPNFGSLRRAQHELEERVAIAWYEAGCP
jgi:hypothetical protein